jgi:hypothetical protein
MHEAHQHEVTVGRASSTCSSQRRSGHGPASLATRFRPRKLRGIRPPLAVASLRPTRNPEQPRSGESVQPGASAHGVVLAAEPSPGGATSCITPTNVAPPGLHNAMRMFPGADAPGCTTAPLRGDRVAGVEPKASPQRCRHHRAKAGGSHPATQPPSHPAGIRIGAVLCRRRYLR